VALMLLLAAGRRRRPAVAVEAEAGEPPSQAAFWTVRLFFPLMSAAIVTQGLSVFLLLGMAFIVLITTRRTGGYGNALVPTFALTVLSAIAWIIGFGFTETLSAPRLLLVFAFALATWCVLLVILQTASRHGSLVVRALVDSLALYLLVSVAAYYVLGLRSGAEENRLLATSTLGFGTRVTFPLSYALSTPPFVAAAFLGAALVLWRKISARHRLAYLAASAPAVIVLLNAANRTPILVAVAVCLVALVAPRLIVRVALPVALAALTLPLWWSAAQGVIAPALQTLSSSVPFLDRGVVDQYASLQDRANIWRVVTDKAASMDPVQLAFGSGAIGQRPSGLAAGYSSYFGNLGDPLDGSAHSALLQQFTDTGIVGAALLLGIVLQAGLVLRRSDDSSTPALAVVYVVLATCGAVESALSTGSPSELAWLLPVVLATGLVLVREPVGTRVPRMAARHRPWSGRRPEPRAATN